MKKYILAIAITLLPLLAVADQFPSRPMSACQSQAPYGFPQTTRENTTPICRSAYALLHDNSAKVSPWVVYTLTPQHTIGCVVRTNAFAPDQSLRVGQRSELADYYKSGYDTGHIANDGDMSWDPIVERESFILSNMVPQLPSLNRGIWKLLETGVRVWAWQTGHTFTVYAGSIYDSSIDQSVGPNRVVVPHAFYKIVIDNTTKKSMAWIFPHKENLGTDLTAYQVTISDVEKSTGIQFSVPDDKSSHNQMLPISIAQFTKAKAAQCH